MDLAKLVTFFSLSISFSINAIAIEDKYTSKDSQGNTMCYWQHVENDNQCSDLHLQTYLQDQKLYEDAINSNKLLVTKEFKDNYLKNIGVTEDQIEDVMKAHCETERINGNNRLAQDDLKHFALNKLPRLSITKEMIQYCNMTNVGHEGSKCSDFPNKIQLPDWVGDEKAGAWTKLIFWEKDKSMKELNPLNGKPMKNQSQEVLCSKPNMEVYFKWACVNQYGLPPCFKKEEPGLFRSFFGGGGSR